MNFNKVMVSPLASWSFKDICYGILPQNRFLLLKRGFGDFFCHEGVATFQPNSLNHPWTIIELPLELWNDQLSRLQDFLRHTHIETHTSFTLYVSVNKIILV